MQLSPRRVLVIVVCAALVATVAGIELSNRTAAAADPRWTHTVTKLRATDDTFVSRESPQRSPGSLDRLVVRNVTARYRQAYVKFVVPDGLLSDGAQIESVVLNLTSQDRSRSAVTVKATQDTAWTEASVNYANAPAGGAAIATTIPASGSVSTADLTSAVRSAGTYAFQLTTDAGVARFYSSESGARQPTLRVTIKRQHGTATPPTPMPASPAASPTATKTPKPPKPAPRPTTTSSAPQPAPTPPTPKPASAGKALLGMSAPLEFWDKRVSEVGSGLQARRLFFTGFDASLSKATDTCNDGMYPVMSFKAGSHSWSQVAARKADAALDALHTRLAALPCAVFVAIHHEPATDGAAADWAAMQVHALPILGGPAGGNIKVGVIGNGWWFSPSNQGLSDAQIGAYITPGVKAVSDVIASDTYQMTETSEEAAPKITGMADWARRTGGVKELGLGEFNAATPAAITNATKALGADPLFAWGCLWNADLKTVHVLTGDRLAAFRSALADW